MQISGLARLKIIEVGSLYPGTCYRGYEDLSWKDYERTFRALLDDPDVPVPIRRKWLQTCLDLDVSQTSPMGSWPLASKRFRAMAASFKEHGYRPELATGGETPIQARIRDDGRICVVQGNKRVALCRLFYGCDFKVDVQIVGRSEKWESYLKRFLESGAGRLYMPVEHPDFADWPSTQPCEERWAMIRQRLGEPGSVVDYGCHTGWFCRRFSRLGWRAVGIDKDPACVELAEIMERWSESEAHRPMAGYTRGDVLDHSPESDAALMLSVVMHTFAQDERAAWRHLKAVSRFSPVMFLDCVWGGYSAHLPFGPEDIGQKIVARTAYERFELLGRTAHENRPFYRFWR